MGLGCSRRQPPSPQEAHQLGHLLHHHSAGSGNTLHTILAVALERWGHLIRTLRKIRRLQRLFHCSGVVLQSISPIIRDRLSNGHWHCL